MNVFENRTENRAHVVMAALRRAESTDACGDATARALSSLGELSPELGRWFAFDDAYRRVPCAGREPILKRFAASRIEWPEGGVPPAALTHRQSLINGLEGERSASLRVEFALPGEAPPSAVGMRFELVLGEHFLRGEPLAVAGRLQAVARALVRVIAPDWGRVGAGIHAAHTSGTHPAVGWLTYLSSVSAPEPVVFPPATVVPIDARGWLIVAQPEPIPSEEEARSLSLAYLRHTLGARVLLDGPSFAPPGQSAPVLERSDPFPISPWAAQSASGRDLRGTSAPGAPPMPEFSVSTGEIMLPLKAALPFDNGPPVPRASRSSGKFEIEQYAALSAELDAYPEHRTFVRMRHGIENEEALQRIQRQFEDQIRTNPDLRDRWTRLRAAWVAGLPGAKGR